MLNCNLKAVLLSLVLLSSAQLACSAEADASETNYKEGGYYFAPSAGYYHFSDKRHLDSSAIAGLTLGYVLKDSLSIEAYAGKAAADSSDTGDGQNFYAYWLDGVYHFKSNQDSFRPYVLAGIGLTNQDDDQVSGNTTLLSINAGGGIEYFISSNISFFTDARDIYTPSGGKNDLMANFGMKFMFEASTSTPIQASNFEPAKTKGTKGFYEFQENSSNTNY